MGFYDAWVTTPLDIRFQWVVNEQATKIVKGQNKLK